MRRDRSGHIGDGGGGIVSVCVGPVMKRGGEVAIQQTLSRFWSDVGVDFQAKAI